MTKKLNEYVVEFETAIYSHLPPYNKSISRSSKGFLAENVVEAEKAAKELMEVSDEEQSIYFKFVEIVGIKKI